MSRTRTWFATVAATLVAFAVPTEAGIVRFDPSVDLSVRHDGNVNNVGTKASGDVGRLAMNLRLSVQNPASAWQLAYRPSREFNLNEPKDASGQTPTQRRARDYTGHNLSVGYSQSRSERSSLNAGLSYYRTERQEFDPTSPDDALTYLPRSTVQRASLRVGGSVSAGRRSSVSWGVGGGLSRTEDIPPVPDPDPLKDFKGFDYNDSESANATVGWAFHNSAQSSLGGSYGFQRFTFEHDDTPTTTVHTAAFNQALTVGRNGSLSYSLGLLRGTSGENSSNNAAVNASYRWSLGPRSSLGIGARQSASAGDGQSGATLDRGGYVTWALAYPRGFSVGVNAAYWEREQLSAGSGGEPAPSAVTVSDHFSFKVGRFIRTGVFHTYRKPDGPGYHSVGLSLSWLIRGERRGA